MKWNESLIALICIVFFSTSWSCKALFTPYPDLDSGPDGIPIQWGGKESSCRVLTLHPQFLSLRPDSRLSCRTIDLKSYSSGYTYLFHIIFYFNETIGARLSSNSLSPKTVTVDSIGALTELFSWLPHSFLLFWLTFFHINILPIIVWWRALALRLIIVITCPMPMVGFGPAPLIAMLKFLSY